MVPLELKGANLSRGVARIDCGPELGPSFLVAYLRSSFAAAYWELCRQGSTFNEVSIETVRELPVPVPSLSEQAAIVGRCSEVSARLERLVFTTQRSLNLLRERRAALITAAITGQIDLRAELPASALEPA